MDITMVSNQLQSIITMNYNNYNGYYNGQQSITMDITMVSNQQLQSLQPLQPITMDITTVSKQLQWVLQRSVINYNQ